MGKKREKEAGRIEVQRTEVQRSKHEKRLMIEKKEKRSIKLCLSCELPLSII